MKNHLGAQDAFLAEHACGDGTRGRFVVSRSRGRVDRSRRKWALSRAGGEHEGTMDDLDALRGTLSVVRETPTLRVQALEKLRRAIVDGKLAPGARLVERKLCDLLDVSRTVVREILRQLEAEGWVVNPPYKGPTVATIGKEEARQIYETRIALEGYAAMMCAARASEEQIDQLERTVDAMAVAARKKDTERHIRAIEQFYEVLLEGSGNAMMGSYLQSLRSRVARLRSFSLSQPDRASVSIGEKIKLVAAIRARDRNLARRLSEEHVHAAAETVFATVFASEASDAPQGEVDRENGKDIAQKAPARRVALPKRALRRKAVKARASAQ
jgi:DNA-binding GntR family transcriptional regulator